MSIFINSVVTSQTNDVGSRYTFKGRPFRESPDLLEPNNDVHIFTS